MGTPAFAEKSLRRLYADGHEITCVITQPDKPRGRGMNTTAGPVKSLALEHGTPVYQPSTLRDGEIVDRLRGFRPDLIVVVAYGKMLPAEILGLPPLGCVNIHGSLLPEYRGAAPVQWAIINGRHETGVTSMYLAEEMDAGDIIYSEKVSIGDEETAGELLERLGHTGAELLGGTVAAISEGKAGRHPQDHSLATNAPPLKKDNSPINWNDPALVIKSKVRGFNPWPVATMELNGVVYKVFSVDISSGKTGKAPGSIVSADENRLEIACADGIVIIKEIQAPGGKRLSAADFLRGRPGWRK